MDQQEFKQLWARYRDRHDSNEDEVSDTELIALSEAMDRHPELFDEIKKDIEVDAMLKATLREVDTVQFVETLRSKFDVDSNPKTTVDLNCETIMPPSVVAGLSSVPGMAESISNSPIESDPATSAAESAASAASNSNPPPLPSTRTQRAQLHQRLSNQDSAKTPKTKSPSVHEAHRVRNFVLGGVVAGLAASVLILFGLAAILNDSPAENIASEEKTNSNIAEKQDSPKKKLSTPDPSSYANQPNKPLPKSVATNTGNSGSNPIRKTLGNKQKTKNPFREIQQPSPSVKNLANTKKKAGSNDDSLASGNTLPHSAVLLSKSSDAEFEKSQNQIQQDDSFGFLKSGDVKIRLAKGAIVELFAPAKFRIQSKNSMRLTQGRMLATVPASAKGFTVETPSASVKDLGTEFELNVDRPGATQLRGLKGLIEVSSKASPFKRRIGAGDFHWISADGKDQWEWRIVWSTQPDLSGSAILNGETFNFVNFNDALRTRIKIHQRLDETGRKIAQATRDRKGTIEGEIVVNGISHKFPSNKPFTLARRALLNAVDRNLEKLAKSERNSGAIDFDAFKSVPGFEEFQKMNKELFDRLRNQFN